MKSKSKVAKNETASKLKRLLNSNFAPNEINVAFSYNASAKISSKIGINRLIEKM